jgi:hypothetical protein
MFSVFRGKPNCAFRDEPGKMPPQEDSTNFLIYFLDDFRSALVKTKEFAARRASGALTGWRRIGVAC